MGADIAFLLGVIVGQWLMLLAIWGAAVRLIRFLASSDESSGKPPSRGTEIIFVPPDDYSDRHKF